MRANVSVVHTANLITKINIYSYSFCYRVVSTDLPDYSEIVHRPNRCLKTKIHIYTAPRDGTYILVFTYRILLISIINAFMAR
jgi:hypothetical protein